MTAEVAWVTGPAGAFGREERSKEMWRVLRWEDPPTWKPRSPGLHRSPGPYALLAEQLRERPGEWAVIYEGPWERATALQTHIRTGATAAFTPAGDFDACARKVDGQRVIWARYLGDGDLP